MSGRIGRPVGLAAHKSLTANVIAAGREMVSSVAGGPREDVAYVVPAHADMASEDAIAGLIAFAQQPLSKDQPHSMIILLLDNGFSVEMPDYLAIEISDPEGYGKIVANELTAKFV